MFSVLRLSSRGWRSYCKSPLRACQTGPFALASNLLLFTLENNSTTILLISLVRHRCCFVCDMTGTPGILERNDPGVGALPPALRLKTSEDTVVLPQSYSARPLRAATTEVRSPLRIWLIDDDDQ